MLATRTRSSRTDSAAATRAGESTTFPAGRASAIRIDRAAPTGTILRALVTCFAIWSERVPAEVLP